MASWLGYATTSFYHAPATVSLPLKSGGPSSPDATESTKKSLSTLCVDSTPPCQLNPFLFNGHLQTGFTAKKREEALLHYKRGTFTSDSTHYPGVFAVDFVTHIPAPETEPQILPRTTAYSDEEWTEIEKGSPDDKPMIIALHGITGGSHEIYARLVMEPLVDGIATSTSTSEGNIPPWEACVINARGCANSSVASPRLFNARATWDIRQLVKWLRKTYPNRPLFAVGFSLGANILVNYLGEEGAACPLNAAVTCSNPWNLEAGSLALQRSWIGLNVYSKTLMRGMRGLFEKHIDQLTKNPDIDVEWVRRTKYLHDFDRAVQCPIWGYTTEGAYYRDAASTDPLLAVRVPVFAINATDDPIAPGEALPYVETEANPFAVLCTTSLGGHLGWFELGGGRWFVKPIVNYLRKMWNEVDFAKLKEEARMQEKLENDKRSRAERPTFNPVGRRLDVES